MANVLKWSAAVALTMALVVGLELSTLNTRAQEGPPRFSEAELFFELNDTDGDLGIHASLDGEEWTHLRIEAPNDDELLSISTGGELRSQTMTQLSFEKVR